MYLLVKRKSANVALCWIIWAMFCVCMLSLIYGIVQFFIMGGKLEGLVAFGVCILVYGVMKLIDISHCWVKYQQFNKRNGILIYEYANVLGIMGNTKNIATITKIDSIKKGWRHLKVYGDVSLKEPMRKTKKCKYVSIFDYTDETYDYLLKYKEDTK